MLNFFKLIWSILYWIYNLTVFIFAMIGLWVITMLDTWYQRRSKR